MTIPTIDQTVSRMKVEILTEIESGRIPDSVQSFSDLHDYVDANEFGGMCEDSIADPIIESLGDYDAFIDYVNHCQCIVHEWLVNGGHRQ